MRFRSPESITGWTESVTGWPKSVTGGFRQDCGHLFYVLLLLILIAVCFRGIFDAVEILEHVPGNVTDYTAMKVMSVLYSLSNLHSSIIMKMGNNT